MFIARAGATGNSVEGNVIGLAADGVTALDNSSGVFLGANASGNRVGGTRAGPGERDRRQRDQRLDRRRFVGRRRATSSASTRTAPRPAASWACRQRHGGRDDRRRTDGRRPQRALRQLRPGCRRVARTRGSSATTSASPPTGLRSRATRRSGVIVQQGANNSEIGGPGAGEGNLISGNNAAGVVIRNSTSGVLVRGNGIGMNKNGEPRRNLTVGVRIFDAAGNTVGGPNAADANAIAYNGAQGIDIDLNDPSGPNFEQPRRQPGDAQLASTTTGHSASTCRRESSAARRTTRATATRARTTCRTSRSLASAPRRRRIDRGQRKPELHAEGGVQAAVLVESRRRRRGGDVPGRAGRDDGRRGKRAFTFTTTPAIELGRTVTATATDAAGQHVRAVAIPVVVQTPPVPGPLRWSVADPHRRPTPRRAGLPHDALPRQQHLASRFRVTNRVDFDFVIRVTGRDGKVPGARTPAFKAVRATIRAGRTRTIRLSIPAAHRRAIKTRPEDAQARRAPPEHPCRERDERHLTAVQAAAGREALTQRGAAEDGQPLMRASPDGFLTISPNMTVLLVPSVMPPFTSSRSSAGTSRSST